MKATDFMRSMGVQVTEVGKVVSCKCGYQFLSGTEALSRDNTTELCSDCARREALEEINK